MKTVHNVQFSHSNFVAGVSDYPTLPSYNLTDLTLRHKAIAKNWDGSVSVCNLFDQNGREPNFGPDADGFVNIPQGLPLAGRNFYAGIRYHY